MSERSNLSIDDLCEAIQESTLKFPESKKSVIEALYVIYNNQKNLFKAENKTKSKENKENIQKNSNIFCEAKGFHTFQNNNNNNNNNKEKENSFKDKSKIFWDEIFKNIKTFSLSVMGQDIGRSSKHELVKSYIIELAREYGFDAQPEFYPIPGRQFRIDCMWSDGDILVAGFEIDRVIAKRSIMKLSELPSKCRRVVVSIGTSRDKILARTQDLPDDFIHIFPHENVLNPELYADQKKNRSAISPGIIQLMEEGKVPEHWEKYARNKKMLCDLVPVFTDFVLYHSKKNSKMANWYAAWQTWVRNRLTFDPGCKNPENLASGRSLTPEDMGRILEN